MQRMPRIQSLLCIEDVLIHTASSSPPRLLPSSQPGNMDRTEPGSIIQGCQNNQRDHTPT